MVQPDKDNIDDAALAKRVQQGDKQAFRELVVRHAVRYRALAYRFVGDTALAEDLVQEAFVKFWTHADRFDGSKAKFTTWFHRVVVNRCLDEKRKRHLEALPEGFDQEDSAPRADKLLEGDKAAKMLQQALLALSERQRTAITLSYLDGLSNMEAAEVMDLNIKAYESLLVRARAKLRTLLQSDRKDLLEAFG